VYTTLVSPLAGRAGIRLIDQGNIVHASDAGGFVVVTQMAPISVIFTLPQKYLPEIIDAMRGGTLVVLAYDQDDSIKLTEGRLEPINNQIDQGIGSIRLKAIFKILTGGFGPANSSAPGSCSVSATDRSCRRPRCNTDRMAATPS
jgi:membrane fusion protein, multidrug efflux system